MGNIVAMVECSIGALAIESREDKLGDRKRPEKEVGGY
jgi:hypothetical protein